MNKKLSASIAAIAGTLTIAGVLYAGHDSTARAASPAALSPADIAGIASGIALGGGDPFATNMRYVKTTRGQANLHIWGHSLRAEDPTINDPVDLVVEDGHFALNVPRPEGSPEPSGTVLILVVDATTGAVVDEGLQGTEISGLEGLGTVNALG